MTPTPPETFRNRYFYYFQSLDRNELLNTMNELKSTIDGDVIVNEQIQIQGAVFFGRIECLKDSNKPTL